MRKSLVGTVVSDKMKKTVVVRVMRRTQDTRFSKIMTQSKKYKAHDEKNECRIGDKVLLVGTRPLSREKRWRVQQILEKGEISDRSPGA